MTREINDLGARTGLTWTDYQVKALEAAQRQPGPAQRRCLYYRTGAGKSYTSLGQLSLWGRDRAVVIAPPATHPAWFEAGELFSIKVDVMSHAKFRMRDTKLHRDVAVIADEMHMFGGHRGKGWAKLDRLARGLQAPMILASATPNYNDAERVYCIQHILDPLSCRGGFLQFLYANCETEQSGFSQTPDVTGFLRFPDAEAYLAALPNVDYLPDDLVYTITDIGLAHCRSVMLDKYGYDRRNHRMIASQIEERHLEVNLRLIGDDGLIRERVYDELTDLVGVASTPVLIFSAHATVAEALAASLKNFNVRHGLVTGKMGSKAKAAEIQRFRDGEFDVLVGTASLATGTDGLDKMCDMLIILDDTDDDSLRRQLIGRIMPRGLDSDASKKQVYRLL